MKYFFCVFYFAICFSNLLSEEIRYVSKIAFSGNSLITSAELRSVIKMQSPNFFNRSKFSQKKLNKDKIALETYYKSKGFLEIDIITEYTSASKNYININYFLTEGIQYHLKDLIISGNKLYREEEILLNIKQSSVNKVYNPARIRKELQLLKRKYLNNGKVDISIMDEINIEGNHVVARISIYEGKTYYIRDILVTGLENVNRKYVLRELLISSGDLYKLESLDISRQRIFDSGLFSSVEMGHNNIDNNLGLIDIEIKVREYKASSVELNFGFEQLEPFQSDISKTGLETDIKWLIGNVWNTSSNIEIEARLASEINSSVFNQTPLIERDFSILYRNPWTYFLRIPFNIKYFHEEETDTTNLIINGITYTLLFNKNLDTRYEINSTIEIIQSKDSTYSHNEREPVRNINFRYISNNVQNPLNPIGGNYFSFSSSLYGSVLGGKRHFFKVRTEYRKYFSIFNNILAARFVYGFIKQLDKNNNLPSVYKFELGGETTLRGWPDATHPINADGAFINDMVNLEYRFPLGRKFGGYIFIDSGRLYNEIKYFTNVGILWNYGVGLVYNTKLGPVRIDMGFPYGDVSNSQLHVSLLYMY